MIKIVIFLSIRLAEQDLMQEIQERTGISTVGTLTLLGIKLTDMLQGSIAATYDHIDTKAITRQIRISTKKGSYATQKTPDTSIFGTNVHTRIHGTRQHCGGEPKNFGYDSHWTMDANGRARSKRHQSTGCV